MYIVNENSRFFKHSFNRESVEKLVALGKQFVDQNREEYHKMIGDRSKEAEGTEGRAKIEEKIKKMQQIKKIIGDIEQLNRSPESYQAEKMQFFVGASIINLMNLMNNLGVGDSKTKTTFHGAIECMSGKDRTSYVSAVAQALFILSERRGGEYISHTDLKENSELRKELASIVVPILVQGGSLEITQLNTGARGFKVSEESNLDVLFDEFVEFIQDVQGLSSMVSA